MLVYFYLVVLLKVVTGDKERNTYSPIPYYNMGGKHGGGGVGVLQDLSNARILSNEPFIISFEFPKLLSSGKDSRKNRFGVKRTKTQRKKNRKPREFRHIIVPASTGLLERRKRLQIMRQPPGLENIKRPLLLGHSLRRGKSFPNENLSGRTGRVMDIGNQEIKDEQQREQQQQQQQPVQGSVGNQEIEKVPENEEMEIVYRNKWENMKKKWNSLYLNNKEGSDNDVEEEKKMKDISRKTWANCQLLKVLKAPQRNPYFYKLLPPNYPALIMSDEKQLECKEFYDILGLAKDKKMVEEKIEQLEQILSEGNNSASSESRRKREAPAEEVKKEDKNTLQDESLQGKSEGEVRSDRSKRTKERQHIRRQRSKEPVKEKTKRLHRSSRKSAASKSEKQQHKDESESVKRDRRKDGESETEQNKTLEKSILEPKEDSTEKKREKQEIKTGKDNSLQDVFSPSEVNKVIRQKEAEANIFYKFLKVMKKFEDNNPYDESFRPQKRESDTKGEIPVVRKSDSSEDEWELEDTIKKLAKVFKVLGVKAEAAKKKGKESEESSSEESDEVTAKKTRAGKTPKCTCADCPFCQDCFRCFKECRKAALAAKNQTPVSSAQVAAGKGSNTENETSLTKNSDGDRGNNVKLERMYRSKLPPSRDLVRVYFDNPENKLLVWTKRGRRTMPWGPLTSDLQLYRDRARQILKSAEDILHRIRETEDKLHTGNYDESEQGTTADKTQSMKNMDDIIKKVVNEDETKNMLRTPWEAELEKGVLDGKVQLNQKTKHFEDSPTYNIFKDGIREGTEIPKESLKLEDDEVSTKDDDKVTDQSEESYQVGRVQVAEPEVDDQTNENEEENSVKDKSVEAAVLPIEKDEVIQRIDLNHYDSENVAGHVKASEERIDEPKEKQVEEEEEEEEVVPAKVEAVKPVKIADEDAATTESSDNSQTNRKQAIEYMKKVLARPENSEEVRDENEKTTLYNESDKADSHDIHSVVEGDRTQEVVEKAYSEEKDTSYSRESEEVEKAESEKSEEKEYEGRESEDVEKAMNEESEEKLDSRESEEVEEARSEKSEEESKSDGQESEDVEKTRNNESEEKVNSQESEEVEKSLNEESEEHEKSYSESSEEVEKTRSEEKSYSQESDTDGANREKSESGEKEGEDSGKTSEEVKMATRQESEEEPKASSKEEARENSGESQDLENSSEKMITELKKVIKEGETGAMPTRKSWQQIADMEKSAEKAINELKKAVKSEYEKEESEDEEEEEDESLEQVEKTMDESEQEETSKTLEETGDDADKNSFQDHMKSIEENYIIKGVKQTKQEKEAILKALMNVEKEEGILENEYEGKLSQQGTNIKNDGISLETVVEHLGKGQMDEKDLDVIKKLDESEVDALVGEMQKNDEKGIKVNCETRMKLCEAVCACSKNTTDSDMTKYEIIKGFLAWLKDLNMDKMVPISV